LLYSPAAYSQEAAKPSEAEIETLKRANDPMANAKACNVQDYIVSSLYGLPGSSINQLLLRYSQPLGKFLLRGTMPFIVSAQESQPPLTGLGDFNAFAIYNFYNVGGDKLGIGPALVAPTGTNNLAAGKWQGGIAALAFFASSRVIQAGSLLQWQASFAGEDDRPDVSILIPQIFFIWQLGGGFCFRSTGVSTFDLKSGHYSVPIGLGVGKVVKTDHVVFNIFAEPQFTVLARGAGQPKFQTLVGFNTQV